MLLQYISMALLIVYVELSFHNEYWKERQTFDKLVKNRAS